ncbi:hypothetical protein [Leptothrix ochracea]|uniref:hypothetical protein n=1 Tax=Leptothrix ochracea TaxID=735331 RepID=UPI0034E24193
MKTFPLIAEMHDATLESIKFEWSTRTCVFEFSGSPQFEFPFSITFSGVTQLLVPATLAWGPSASILEIQEPTNGHFQIAMQSGDTITVMASNHTFQQTAFGVR